MLENGIENDETIKAYGVLCKSNETVYERKNAPFDGPLAADTEMLSRKKCCNGKLFQLTLPRYFQI